MKRHRSSRQRARSELDPLGPIRLTPAMPGITFIGYDSISSYVPPLRPFGDLAPNRTNPLHTGKAQGRLAHEGPGVFFSNPEELCAHLKK